MTMYALFDIGGTKTRVAASRDLTSFDEPMKFDTPRHYEDGVTAIAEVIKKVCGDEKITRVAGGIRGPLLPDRSGIVDNDILVDWRQKSFAHDLGKNIDAPVL